MVRIRLWVAAGMMGIALAVSGCAPESGLYETGLVVAVAVDPGSASNYGWSFMFPNPTITPGNEINVPPTQAYFTLQVSAPSFTRAIQQVSTLTDRQVYLGDVQVVVVNGHLGASAITHIIASMTNLGEFPPRAWLALAAHSAAATLRTSTPEETVPTLFLSSYFKCPVCHAIHSQIRLWQAWDDLELPSRTAVIPWITEQHDQLSIDRVAWLTPSRLIVCTPAQTEAWAVAMGRYQYGAIVVRADRMLLSAKNVTTRVRRRVVSRDSGVSIRWLITVHGQWQLKTPHTMAASPLLAQQISHQVMSLIATAEKSGVDPFESVTQADWVARTSRIPPMEVTIQCDIVPTGRIVFDDGAIR